MDIALAGAHGKIAQRLGRLLARDGHRVYGIVRNPDHAAVLRDLGVEPVVADLEHVDAERVTQVLDGVDAVVFAAGAGPGSGPARKVTMDLGGASLLAEGARRAGVRRYVMVSSMGADAAAPDDGGFGSYLRAKGMADDALRRSGLDWTVVRPGRLTDEPGTGGVAVGTSLPSGQVSRDDVAATLAAVLGEPATVGHSFDLVAGPTPILQALADLADAPAG